jgi:hypothetical protein
VFRWVVGKVVVRNPGGGGLPLKCLPGGARRPDGLYTVHSEARVSLIIVEHTHLIGAARPQAARDEYSSPTRREHDPCPDLDRLRLRLVNG